MSTAPRGELLATSLENENASAIAAQQAEIKALTQGLSDLARSTDTQFSRIVELINRMESKIDSASRPQTSLMVSWIGLAFTALTVIGGLAYYPLRADMTRIEMAFEHEKEFMTPRSETALITKYHEKYMDELAAKVERLEQRGYLMR